MATAAAPLPVRTDAPVPPYTRAPIFDRQLRVAGWSFVFGETGRDGFVAGPLDVASVDAALTVARGRGGTGGAAPAWVTPSRDLLLGGPQPALAADAVVLEVPASFGTDRSLVEACAAWRADGYRLAIADAPDDPGRADLLAHANAIVFSVAGGGGRAVAAATDRLRVHERPLVAVDVDAHDVVEACRGAGVSLVRGMFYRQPIPGGSAELPVSVPIVVRILDMLESSDVDDRVIERELRADPALSFKFLKTVNAAAVGGRGVGSILHAIQLMGRNGLQRWLALLAVAIAPRSNAVERERTQLALERARFCELIALGTSLRGHANSIFLAGMLSQMAAFVGMTAADLVSHVRVSQDVADALLGRQGLYTRVLTLATAFADGDWPAAADGARALGVLSKVPGWYAEAATWSRESIERL